jgi:hypothetical protein
MKLGEYFMKLPWCNGDRLNYVMYRDQFQFTAAAAGLEDHLDLIKKEPMEPVEPRLTIDPNAPQPTEGEAPPQPQLTDE